MATEIPVSDVLCEAIEYLSKLGANLKTRTQNLRDKKIRKEKLIHPSSVHKAANKVLMICELSKKSLDNVEKGVRSILSRVDTMQSISSIEVNQVHCKTERNAPFQHFEYCSHTLRICKTVPIKHFMSAKVYAKHMPLSMYEKYPVYYKCKLYRMRKTLLRKSMEQLENKTPEMHGTIQNKELRTYKASTDENKSKNIIAKLPETALDYKEKENTCDTLITTSLNSYKDTDHKLSILRRPSLSKKKAETENIQLSLISKDACKPTKSNVEEKTIDVKSDDIEMNHISSKKKYTRVLNTSSDDDENMQHIGSKSCDGSGSFTVDKEVSNMNNEILPKKQNISKSRSDDDNCNKPKQSTDHGNEKSQVVETSKMCGDKTEQHSVAPKIKCIHINKLLKPNIVKNLISGSEKTNTSVKSFKIINNKNIDVATNSQTVQRLKTKDNVSKKRNEVHAFKAKEFEIKLYRLPSLSKVLLLKYKLKRITHNGSVLCEMNLVDNDKINKFKELKNKLLNDSDSDDQIIRRSSFEARKRRCALIFNSHSDDHGDNSVNVSKKQNNNKGKKSKETENLIINSFNNSLYFEDTKNSSPEQVTRINVHEQEESILKKKFDNKNSNNILCNEPVATTTEVEENNLMSNEISNENVGNAIEIIRAPENIPELCNIPNVINNEIQFTKNNISMKPESPQNIESRNDLLHSVKKNVTEENEQSKHSLLNEFDSDDDVQMSLDNCHMVKQKASVKVINDSKSIENTEIPTTKEKCKTLVSHLDSDKNKTIKLSNKKSDESTLKESDPSNDKCNSSDSNIYANDNLINKDICPDNIELSTLNVSNETNSKKHGNASEFLDKYDSNPGEGYAQDVLIEKSNNSKYNNQEMDSHKESKQNTDKNNIVTDEDVADKCSLICKLDSLDNNQTNTISLKNNINSKRDNEKHSANDNNDFYDVSMITEDIESGQDKKNKELNKRNDKNYSKEIEDICDYSNLTQTNVSDGKSILGGNEVGKQQEISPNKIKSSLLNSSDDSDNNKTSSLVKKLRRKRIKESIKAKKMLLVYSSSSDGEVPNTQTCRGHEKIDPSLTKNTDEDEHLKLEQEKMSSNSISSHSSDDDLVKRVKKKRKNTHLKLPIHDQKNECSEILSSNSDSSSSQMVRSKSKPGSSISDSSNTKDDKDVDRLTNFETLEHPRRRRGATTAVNVADTTTTEKTRNMPKGPSLIGEELLNAESSSESNSDDENLQVEEDVPEVTLTVTNNGIGHISKDDLLGEDSDSSASHNTNTPENTQDESEEENVKSKRRKGNTISSDSETGALRKKDRDVKLSDFEDSDDSSEQTKRTKRTKKATDSDASVSSSDTNKKKRRRIKQINESDVSDSDGETEGKNKHGRKNIRKVMGKNQLEEATKKAAREEKERIARITERQKLYNNLEFDESGKPDEVVLEKVVLDFDPETKEPLIEVDRGLVKKLKPHQANGIKFMWDACFESVKRIKKDRGSGCILAHCMGLGKTLQVISLTHTLLTHASLTGVNRVLVVCPLSTVLNWVNEFRMWLKHADSEFEVDVYELSKNKQNLERASQLNQWFQGGGVCVLGYEMFRNLSADNNKKFKKKMLKSFQESLVDPGPDLVVCDEGHLLKNEKTSLSQSMNKVKTRRRIVLTGTPLQNNLKEYYCMVQFVKPNLLGKYNEYLNRFVNPITNGQYTDSTEHDIRIMKRRSHVLHKMLDGAVQRRDYGVLAPFLPPKHEYVLFITLSEVQIKLYQTYLENYSRRPQPGKSSGFLFPDFQSLQRIWTHPLVLKYNSERYEIMQQKKREREEDDSEGSLVDFIDDDSTPEETSTEDSTDDSSDLSDDSRKKSKKKKSSKKNKGKDKVSTRRGTRANPDQDEEEPVNPEVVEVKYENPTEWWIKLVSDDELEDIHNSHKLVLLFDILRQCETIGDKLLVFSQSLYSLDLIEHFLGKVDEATQEGRMDEKLGGHFGSWSPGIDYFRLDGSTSCENRSIWCKHFNREDNPRARLFLISTRAGGLGINLVAANRVVIFDVSWNPSHDVQSIFRVYRFGQKKPCYVYRFLAMGTMEEKIYERQVTKQAISKRVIDEQQIDRHYAENDLAELYKFEPKPEEPKEVPALPKDRLFAEMLREHEAQIYKYHEHDSLLENKEEETLTEEERKAAWEDFENEKNKPPPAPFPTAWPMHNGMMPGLLAQQQQQQAYAMLAAMMGQDATKPNENQLTDMMSLLYNTPGMFGGYDYGMMQKMNNYKYAQPGMMNPMMASVMNAAAGSGMGGTSGLQYEPPWQRQHQQQMRLQQLMQQQNSMGAKYYAGGLGSRDPVAMALQQQRAREIMLSGGASGVAGGVAGAGVTGSRPRGRPPLRARVVTPTGPSDVVNLDSD